MKKVLSIVACALIVSLVGLYGVSTVSVADSVGTPADFFTEHGLVKDITYCSTSVSNLTSNKSELALKSVNDSDVLIAYNNATLSTRYNLTGISLVYSGVITDYTVSADTLGYYDFNGKNISIYTAIDRKTNSEVTLIVDKTAMTAGAVAGEVSVAIKKKKMAKEDLMVTATGYDFVVFK